MLAVVVLDRLQVHMGRVSDLCGDRSNEGFVNIKGVITTPKYCILRVTNRDRRLKTSNIQLFHFYNIILVLLYSKQKRENPAA